MNKTKTLITVHSGGMNLPANSRAYLEKACDQNPDIIEIDIRETIDKVVVLSHDPNFPGSDIEIVKLRLKEAKKIYPDLMTLEEAIEICAYKGFCLNLDIKELHVIPSVVTVVKKYLDRCCFIFSGCGPLEIRKLFSIYPEARVLYNVPARDRALAIDYIGYIADSFKIVKQLGCFGLNISYKDLRPEIIGYSQIDDIPIFVWTVDDRKVMHDLVKMGIYSITTNNPELLRDVIEDVASSERRLSNVDWVKKKLL